MARLDELGVLVVAAAGNEGTGEPRYPAAYPSVIGVGADRPRAPRLRAQQPRPLGGDLRAGRRGALHACRATAFAFGSGTSFAAAHVSGALAVLLGAGARAADGARGAVPTGGRARAKVRRR